MANDKQSTYNPDDHLTDSKIRDLTATVKNSKGVDQDSAQTKRAAAELAAKIASDQSVTTKQVYSGPIESPSTEE